MRLIAFLPCLLILGACGGPSATGPAPAVATAGSGEPAWVRKGSGAFDDQKGRAFFGVGIADGIQNEALIRQAADDRARGALGRIFHTYVASMTRDYQRSTTAGDFKNSTEEQDVVAVQKTLTETTLRGVEIRDHWVNPRSGAVYALAVLPLRVTLGNLDGTEGMSPRLREHVRTNAHRAFQDLDRELGKRAKSEPPPEAARPPAATEPAPPEPAETRVEPQPSPEPSPPAAPAARRRIGLHISGKHGATIQTCFAEKLTAAGYQLFEGTSDVDVMVRGKLRYKKAGEIRGSAMLNVWAEVRLSDMADGRTIAALEAQVKASRPTLRQSIQTAVTVLCRKVSPRMVNKLNAHLGAK